MDNFVDAALPMVKHGGYAYVTCTDALALCGKNPPALSSRFGGAHVAANVAGVNETALRVFVGDAVRRGAAQGLKLTPVFSLFHPHGPVFRAMPRRARRGRVDERRTSGTWASVGSAERRADSTEGKNSEGVSAISARTRGTSTSRWTSADRCGSDRYTNARRSEGFARAGRRRLGRRRRRVRVRETRGDAQGTKDHRETSRDVRVRVRSEAAAVLPPDGRAARARGGEWSGVFRRCTRGSPSCEDEDTPRVDLTSTRGGSRRTPPSPRRTAPRTPSRPQERNDETRGVSREGSRGATIVDASRVVGWSQIF